MRHLSSDEEAGLRAALTARDEKAQVDRDNGNRWREERRIELLPRIEGYADSLTPVVVLALNTGMRKGELATLEWSGVNFAAELVTVRASYSKSGEARHIPLNTEALEVLRGLRATRKGSGAIFGSKSFTKAWKGVLAAAGITDFRFHDLRHTFASNLVMAGVALNTVRELLGHSDIEMTIRYAHLARSHKLEAVNRLNSKIA
ncbi:MAG: site-specific integrase [Thermomonas sp.]